MKNSFFNKNFLLFASLLLVLSLPAFNNDIYASNINLRNGDEVNLGFKITCTDTQKNEVPFPIGNLIVSYRNKEWYNFDFLPQPVLIDFFTYKLEAAQGDLNIKLSEERPKGEYYVEHRTSTIGEASKPGRITIMQLGDKNSDPRGIVYFSPEEILHFKTGYCPDYFKPSQNDQTKVKEPAEQPKDNQALIKEQCKAAFPGLVTLGCSNEAKKCLNQGGQVNDCIAKGILEESKYQEAYKRCFGEYQTSSELGGACADVVKICTEKGGIAEDCVKKGKQWNLDLGKYTMNCFKDNKEVFEGCLATAWDCIKEVGEEDVCFQKIQEAVASKNPNPPAQGSDNPEQFFEYLKGLFKEEAQLACEGKDPNWNVIFPDYQAYNISICVDRATTCFNSGYKQAAKSQTILKFVPECIQTAMEQTSVEKGPKTATKPADIGQGDNTQHKEVGGTAPSEPEASPPAEEPVDVPTKITPFIFGRWEGSNINIANIEKGRITVGARLTPAEVPEEANFTTNDCIRDEVSLTLRKTQGDEIKISKEIADSGEKDENLAEGKFQNCQSYYAPIDGPGSYTLMASYNGGTEGRYNFLPAPVSGNQVTVIGGKEAIKTESKINVKVNTTSNKQTKARTLLAGKFGKDQRVVWKTQSSNVAGIRVEQQGDSYVATPDANSEERLVLTPEIQIEGRDFTASQNEIPTVHFSVVKVTNSGENLPLFNMPNYPNGQSKIFSETDLGDLNSINHIEATVTGTDLNSEYEIKPEDIRIDVNPSGTPVPEATYVNLTTDPLEISQDTPEVTITASTNRLIENPVFESTVNGGEPDLLTAQESSDNCADGTGICRYSYTFYQPGPGTYSLTFKNGDASDTVEFTINPGEAVDEAVSPEDSGTISVEILYKGDVIGDGFIDLDTGENVFERVIHTRDGDIRQSFTIMVEEPAGTQNQPQEQPDQQQPAGEPEQLSWFCEGNLIMENKNGEISQNKECQNGQVCKDLINVTPGYPVDAVCEDIQPTGEQPAPQNLPDAGGEPSTDDQPQTQDPVASDDCYAGESYPQCGYNTDKSACQWDGSDEFAPNDVIEVIPLVDYVDGKCNRYFLCRNVGYQSACD